MCPYTAQVFTALAAAQKATGFRHWDLRLSNIMQHKIKASTVDSLSEGVEAAYSGQKGSSIQKDDTTPHTTFKIIDFGHGQMKGR